LSGHIPPELHDDLERARRLELWTIGWILSVVAVMVFAMGSSQAMKTALIEDFLSLVPSIVFLIALHFERKGPDDRFPFGYHRVNSLAFIVSAVALAVMGALLLVDSAITVIEREHVTVAPVQVFGEHVWLGWLMIAALGYSVVPPVILGRMKLPIARRLQDKVLHTDAMMQRADWMTGLAGIGGIIGIAYGLWWADAAAAGIISFSILHDGLRALRTAAAELVDGVPRRIDGAEMAGDAEALQRALELRFPEGSVRLRETGRLIDAQVCGIASPGEVDLREIWPGLPERAWRLAQLSFVPPPPNDVRS
jgi:cation diffusion facilitator family transporter